MSDKLKLESTTVSVTLPNEEELTVDAIEVEMFLQEIRTSLGGETNRPVFTYEVVPKFQDWLEKKTNKPVEYGIAWQLLNACRNRFEEVKKKFVAQSS